ncbi:ABC transporter substrate-binding protein [Bacillus sp. UMB0893]|uniref:ABC transporter substrate-binding protein n=1 Tax=Bacillus sp. UMB0893 TaxID=2066053 RepID=UPI000C7936E3|nr:sugar ABC transporter substrate-binding protein [Bacillus sp. UMB0893]PLR67544.1 ABC transporter substrate-binding protein [Bacillus sp. UMB0893]
MKKKAIFIICSIILIIMAGFTLSFFDRFSSGEKDQAEIENDDKDKIQLTFWRNGGTNLENKAYKEIISAFESAHPDIKINMVSVPYGDYELRLRTEIAAGNQPDVMSIDSPNLALYADSGWLLSIDSYMRSEGDLEDIPSATLEGLIYEDEIYLSPIVESGVALFYNKHLFKKAGLPFPSEDPDNPMTWDEVLEIAKKINNPSENVFGIDPAQGFSDGESPAYFKMPLLWQFGADVLSPDATTADGYLNSNEALEALQFYQDLYQKHKVAAVELPPDPFITGKLAMTVMGSWSLADFEKNVPEFKLGEDFGIAPLPKDKNQVVPNGGWSLGISQKSKYPDEAWEFIQYATSYEGSKKYVELTGDIPARYSVSKEFPELQTYPKNIFVQQAQKYSENRPVTPAYPVVSEAIKKLFEDIGIGGESVESAAAKAVEKINKGLKEKQNP